MAPIYCFDAIAQKFIHKFYTPKINYDKKEINGVKTTNKITLPNIQCKKNSSNSFDRVDSGSLASSIKNIKIQRQISCFNPKILNYRRKYQIAKNKYYANDYIQDNKYQNSGPVSMALYSGIGTNFAKGVFADIGFLSQFYRKWNLMYNIEFNYSYTSRPAFPKSESYVNYNRI
ncbi:MAG: hypothetical protein ACRCR9_00675, partial [Chitinophagaceae bacterium]